MHKLLAYFSLALYTKLAMEDMIQKRMKIISDLKAEMNSLKENYTDMLEQDPLYQEVQEKESEVREEKKASKTRLMTNTVYNALDQEIKEKRQEIKENNEILSVELVELFRKDGTTEVTDADGNVKKLKFSVRLVNG